MAELALNVISASWKVILNVFENVTISSRIFFINLWFYQLREFFPVLLLKRELKYLNNGTFNRNHSQNDLPSSSELHQFHISKLISKHSRTKLASPWLHLNNHKVLAEVYSALWRLPFSWKALDMYSRDCRFMIRDTNFVFQVILDLFFWLDLREFVYHRIKI